MAVARRRVRVGLAAAARRRVPGALAALAVMAAVNGAAPPPAPAQDTVEQDTAAQDARAVEIMERTAARYAGVKTLCADFEQDLEVPLLGEERRGRGRMCQARPDRFAMRFTDPPGDAVVVDGTWVWIYYPSLDSTQVIRLPMERRPGGFDFHREFLERPARRYTMSYLGEEKVDGRATHHIRLVPRAETSYQTAEVWIEKESLLLRRVRIAEENGSVRTVTFTRVELDPAVPDAWFTFTPPAGAQVISG